MSDVISNDFPGAAPSIVEFFSIEALHGYRTVTLSSNYAATVLIARNGSGKTTLLGALDAFLKGQFFRLANLKFSSIKCKLKGVDDVLSISQEEVQAIAKVPHDDKLFRLAGRIGVEPAALYEYIQSDLFSKIEKNEPLRFGDNDVHDKLFRSFRYVTTEVVNACWEVTISIETQHVNIRHVRAAVRRALDGVEVVYLPTYRRIELPIVTENPAEARYSRRKSISEILGISKRGLFSTDIQFGLPDIPERLSALNDSLLIDANRGYSKISADIINELISGAFDREDPSVTERPNKDSLDLFFTRLKEGRRQRQIGSDFVMPNIGGIYGSDISSESNKFLNYFLGKLNQVIRSTREIDKMVDDFVDSCNRYLSGTDESTELRRNDAGAKRSFSIDDKVLKLDRTALTIKVEGLATKRKMSIESLSSGEKQMISLFARLYLYPGKKIILIDEPELSMSIDWQRKILMDVISAPSCDQIIAITHSPFIFDNELEPFAQPLSLRLDGNLAPDVDDGGELDV